MLLQRYCSILALVPLLTISGTVLAAGPDNNSRGHSLRMDYEGSKDMPDRIALSILARFVTRLAKKDYDSATNYTMTYAGLETKSAAQMVDYLSTLNGRIETERAGAVRSVLCSENMSNRPEQASIRLMNTADDARLTVYGKYLGIARSELNSDQNVALLMLLETTKLSSSYAQVDHEELYKSKSPDMAIYRVEFYCAHGEEGQ